MKLRSLSASLLAFLLVLAIVVPAIADDPPLEARYDGGGIGKNVSGTYPTSTEDLVNEGEIPDPAVPRTPYSRFGGTMPMSIFDDGASIATDLTGFCIDMRNTIDVNDRVTQTDWAPNSPRNIGPVTWLLNNTTPTTQTEAAATQAAIWYYTDDFLLDNPESSSNSQALYDRWSELVADASGKEYTPPSLTLSIAEPDTTEGVAVIDILGPYTVTSDQPITFEVTGGVIYEDPDGSDEVDLGVSHPTGTTFFVGAASAGTVTVTASAGATFDSGLIFTKPGIQSLILAEEIDRDSSVSVTGTFSTPTPDVTFEKQASGQSVSPGGSFDYTLTASNNGTAAATNVVITDDVPALLEITSTPTIDTNPVEYCEVSGNVVTCDIGQLAVDESVAVTIPVAVPPLVSADTCVPVSNDAVLDADDLSLLTAQATVNVDCSPGLDIDKDTSLDGDGPVQPGDTFDYLLTVTSTGTAIAQNVVVTDTVPDAFTVSATPTVGSLEVCTVAGNDVSCDLGDLDPASSSIVTIPVTVDDVTDPDSCAAFPNSASASADGDVSAQSESIDVVVAGCEPDVSIEKTTDGERATLDVGGSDEAAFTITVSNAASATGNTDVLTVTDVLDDRLTFERFENETNGTCSVAGGVVTCTTDVLAPGDAFSVDVVVSLGERDLQDDGSFCGTVPNVASVAEGDQSLGSDGASVDIVGCEPDVSLEKSNGVDDGTPQIDVDGSDTATFTLTTTNSGTAADTFTIVDSLPAGLSFVGFIGDAEGCTEADGTITCPNVTLLPGGTFSVGFEVRAEADGLELDEDGDLCGVVTNVASIASLELEDAADVEVVGCAPELDIDKEAIAADDAVSGFEGDPSDNVIQFNAATAGQTRTITYRYTVTNDASATAVDVVDALIDRVIDQEAEGDDVLSTLDILAELDSEDGACSIVGDDSSRELAPGEQLVIDCIYTITSGDIDRGEVYNEVTLNEDLVDDEIVLIDTFTVAPPPTASISLVKTADIAPDADGSKVIEVVEGEALPTITYLFVVTNTGQQTLNDVELVDQVSTTLASDGPALSTTGLTAALRAAIGGANLAPGASVEVSFDYQVTALDVERGGIANVATASGTPAVTGGDRSATDDELVSITEVLGEIEEAPEEPEETPEPEDTTEVPEEEESDVLDEIVEQDDVTEASDQQVLSRTGVDLVLLTPLGLLLAVLGLAVLRLTTRRRSDVVR